MRKSLSVLAALWALVFSGRAQGTNALPKIPAAEAAKHLKETVIVTGKVAQVTVRPSVVFLNIDKPYPDAPFTAVILAAATNKFGALTNFKGKDVEITGTIKEYHGKPEIVLSNSTQLTVVGQK